MKHLNMMYVALFAIATGVVGCAVQSSEPSSDQSATAALTADISEPLVALILKNTGTTGATTTDDLGIWHTQPRTAPAGGQITDAEGFGGSDVFSNVTVNDTLSNAKCTFHTQSVFSSFFGHYQITANAPGVFNSSDGTRIANCTESLTFRDATSGDYDSTMTVSFQNAM